MQVYKKPEFENDSYMFVIDLVNDKLAELSLFDLGYYSAKHEAFKTKDISKRRFLPFVDRPSFANFDDVSSLEGTIYTHTCEDKNNMSYERIIYTVKENYRKSRRCAVNFADTLYNYMRLFRNTSCLNSIHYYNDNVTLYFRASDIQNELLIDLMLIMEFFIKPVGEFKTLTVMASTSQNIGFDLENLIQK